MRQSLAVVVADERELSPSVVSLFEVHNVPVFEVGVRCCNADVVRRVFSEYDVVWNIGSVGSKLPLYSVFVAGFVSKGHKEFRIHPAYDFKVETVDVFVGALVNNSFESVDMELFTLHEYSERYKKSFSAIKYVSGNFGSSVEGWHSTIAETAFIVQEPLLQLLKTKLDLLWKNEN